MAQFEISWEAPEFEYREKDVSWYWITIIIAAIIIAFSVWQRNFLFGLFIVIAEILVIVWGNQKPRIITFTLSDTHLGIGEHKTCSLKDFESWSAEELGDGWADLAFNFRTKLKTPIKIMVADESLEEVRVNLKPVLKEIPHEPSLVDSIEKFLRF